MSTFIINAVHSLRRNDIQLSCPYRINQNIYSIHVENSNGKMSL